MVLLNLKVLCFCMRVYLTVFVFGVKASEMFSVIVHGCGNYLIAEFILLLDFQGRRFLFSMFNCL